MSHVVTVRTQVRDPEAVRAACQRLDWPRPFHGEAQLYAERLVGLVVQPPGWVYPAVCDLAQGELRYDLFEGHWGDPALLDRFLQIYAVEKAKLEARKAGLAVFETPLEDGSIRLVVRTGGGA